VIYIAPKITQRLENNRQTECKTERHSDSYETDVIAQNPAQVCDGQDSACL